MGEVRLPRALARRHPVERMRPFPLPQPEFLFELFPAQTGEPAHESVQGNRGLKPRILREIAVRDTAHVELAHLDPVLREHAEKAAHAVDDDALDGIASLRYRVHRLHIVRHRLVPDEGDI